MSFFNTNIKFELDHIEKDKEYKITVYFTNNNISTDIIFTGYGLIKFINQLQDRDIFMINFPDKNKNIIIVRNNIAFINYNILD